MINAYDKTYLDKAQTSLGRMMDYAVYDLNYEADSFFHLFLVSGNADRFGNGDYNVIVGKSGVELARITVEAVTDCIVTVKPRYTMNRSPEYWAGWALSYYQWLTALSFHEITEVIPISEIITMYTPYHEMDIRQFCDKMTEKYRERRLDTNLKRIRTLAGITQNELALQSGVPLRTIQQYEQKRKNINKAQAEYLISLSRALSCPPADLIEKV
jgi:DNA-binding transcriptional regulator YiaG